MISPVRAIVASSCLLLSSNLIADMTAIEGLAPLQAHTVVMSDYTAVIYYTVDSTGNYEIVTTVGPNENVSGAMTQHRVKVGKGQSYSMQLASDGTQPGKGITFSTDENSLTLASY